jgi:hypothetical protein
MLVAVSSLALPHMAPLPETSRETRTMRALLALRADPSKRFVVHVIAARCSCTERLFAHLAKRGRMADADEIVLFVGNDTQKEQTATHAEFRYATESDAELVASYALESAPVLFIFEERGRLGYAGGYFNHPATLTALDQDLYAKVVRGETPAPLPVYGCAVSEKLRDAVDPLGIVYRR